MRQPGDEPGADEVRISCVIPAYNAERHLREALDSALRQSLPPREIVVVDDGSTDGTADLAAGFGGSVRLIRQPRSGSSAARNTAVAASTEQVLAFLDADDVWEPDKLRLQVELLRSHPGPVVVSAHTRNFWDDSLREQAPRFRDQWVSQPYPGVNASSVLLTRSLFDRIGGFDPTLSHGEIAEWLDRARDAGAAFVVHPDVLVRRRIHEGNKSRATAKRDQFFRSLKAHLEAERRSAHEPAPRPLGPGGT